MAPPRLWTTPFPRRDPNADNRGFAAASNQGAVVRGSECLLFLNPDTCFDAGSLALLLVT
jgi:GT2 family glycosyltransferase